MFTTYVAQPIFNVLVAIYAILPGHNFGLAVILFTILVRLILWPLVKKQLHQTKVMRKVQPQLKEIKAKTKGNRQEEARLTMELYKEKGVKPMSSILVLIIQLPILFALYRGLYHVIQDPHQMYDFAYPFLQHLGWMQQLGHNIGLFDESLFGLIDLTRSVSSHGFYFPAFVLVVITAIVQYFASKQLLPTSKDARGLRAILKDAGSGNQVDQSEISGAIGKSTIYLLPAFIFILGINLPSALVLYWLVTSAFAWFQQGLILREDEEEMEEMAESKTSKTTAKPATKPSAKSPKPKSAPKKRASAGSTARTVSITTGSSAAKPKPKTSKSKAKRRRKR